MKTLFSAALISSLLSGAHAMADQPTTLSITPIKGNLSLISNKGGNILLSQGEDGLLIIDNGYNHQSDALAAALAGIGDAKGVQYIINTHWHGDHTGANETLGKEATIVAHDNVRKRLSSPQSIPYFKMESHAHSKQGLPSLTYPDSMHIHFNGDTLALQHYPNGHTDSDTAVFFKTHNVVHMGDHLFYPIFPFVDIKNNGNVLSYTKNVKAILDSIDDQTVVIPGHGPVTDKAGLRDFYHMLEGTVTEVKAMKTSGLSLKQAQTKGLTDQWGKWGKGFIPEPTWIEFIYKSL